MATKKISPMLADNKNDLSDLDDLVKAGHMQAGLLSSYKMDGIRAIVKEGRVVSRTLKTIPSMFVQQNFCHLEGYDGELICGEPNSPTVYRDTYSAVQTHGCTTPVNFFVFDKWNKPDVPYEQRHIELAFEVPTANPHIKFLNQDMMYTPSRILSMESDALRLGYEGLILRRLDAPYKYGRSTFNEGYLLKLKRTKDAEAKIVGWEELMHNGNEAQTDERGFTKRTSHKDNLVGMDTLGAILCEGVGEPFEGIPFKIGVFKGFSKAELQDIWNNRHDEVWNTRLAKYTYCEVGVKEAPRHPRGIGFRSVNDV